MAKNFKELQAKMSREARVRSEEAAKKMISEMGLAELREAMDLTQESLADTLHVKHNPGIACRHASRQTSFHLQNGTTLGHVYQHFEQDH